MATSSNLLEKPSNRPRAPFFRWAVRLSVGLLIAGVIVAIAITGTYSEANAGLPLLFFGMVFVVFSVPIAFASAVLAALSLSKGEDHRRTAIGILIVMGGIAWTFKAMPFQFAKALIEGYLQRPLP